MTDGLVLPDLGLIVRLRGADTSGRVTLMESAGQAAGAGPRRHIHAHEDEAFFVIEGTYHWELGDQSRDVEAGATIWLPRGVPHRYVVGPAGGRMLHLYTPGGIDNYFVEWQAALSSGEATTVVAALAGRYGLTYEADMLGG